MATILIPINVYQINQNAPIAISTAAYNPTYISPSGIVVNTVGLSDTNPLRGTGVYVYSQIIMPSGTLYYSGLTAAAVASLANA